MRYPRIGTFLALLVLVSVYAEAQFRPFTSFRVIRTEYFDIIFPRESEASARMLASYADRIYEQMSSMLGIEVRFRIPVVLNPQMDIFNGFYAPFPNPHIVLFDTPMDIEWTAFPDTLKYLFVHELAHAISLNQRQSIGWFFHRIFGGVSFPWVWTNATLFMIEGIAVSLESLSGFGRNNDPLTRQHLRQAVHEGRFLSPIQAAGTYDLPLRVFFHEYGGLFSEWLLQNYGMERYVRLWHEMGRGARFSFSVYHSCFFHVFSNVYNMNFLDAWTAFRDLFVLDNLEENTDEPLSRRYRFFTERNDFIARLAVWENDVFILDGRNARVYVYNTITGRTRNFNVGVMAPYDIDISADGTTMLVSGYRIMGDRNEAVVVEYRTANGRRTGRAFRGMFRARYFRDGVIGGRTEQQNSLIVFESFNGNSEVLFRGTSALLFSGPQVVDNDRFAFVVARGGVRELWLYNFADGGLFRIENADGHNEYWPHMRGLGVSDGKLFFSHNADDRMFKLAALDLETMQAVFSERDFSGGVFNPVSVNGVIYYRGAFSSRDRLLRFPETVGSLSGRQRDLKLVRLDRQSFEAIAMPEPGEFDENDFYNEFYYNEFAIEETLGIAQTQPVSEPFAWETAGHEMPVFETSRYFAIRHMNPFRFWFPMLLFRFHENDEVTLDGGGLFSMMIDPTRRNLVSLIAYADIRYQMAMVEMFSWQNTALGFPLTLNFSDMVIHFEDEDIYRDTRIGLVGNLNRSLGRGVIGLAFGGSYVRIADYDEGVASAYGWRETESHFIVSTGIGLSNIRRRQHELFGTGMAFNLTGASFATSFEPYAAVMFQASREARFPVRLALFGVYDATGTMSLHGVSRTYGNPIFSQFAPLEYRRPSGLNLDWLAGAEAAIGLFSLEIQNNISHIYFNRIFGTLAVRNAFFDGQGHADAEGMVISGLWSGNEDIRIAQSLVFRLGMVFTFHQIQQIVPAFFEPNVWAAWNFSNTITGNGTQWRIGFGFNMRM
ncbi:MAG: hypothetical protein FWB78_06955 [Treponema sp.]|nr:hypothetical protein [Treponema sp.]